MRELDHGQLCANVQQTSVLDIQGVPPCCLFKYWVPRISHILTYMI